MLGWIKKKFKPKLTNYEDKIQYLIKHKTFNIYNSNNFLIKTMFIDKTIEEYIDSINTLIEIDMYNNKCPYRIIREDILYNLSIGDWVVDRYSRMYKDPDLVIKEWLEVSYTLLKIYRIGKDNMSNIVLYNNCLHIRPYIYNIQHIIDKLEEI